MELNDVEQAMDVANAALEHLRARGPLSPQATAAVMLVDFGASQLLSDNEIVVFISEQRILFSSQRLAELSGAATIQAHS